jgi:methyl-accepting chemotaxis protein
VTALSALLHPLAVPRLLLRAADDLSALADVARRDPHPVEVFEQAVSDTRHDLRATLEELQRAVAAVEQLRGTAGTLDAGARQLVDGGENLLEGVEALDARAVALIERTDRLDGVGERLEERTTEVVTGGRDLVETGRDLDGRLHALLPLAAALERHLPQIVRALEAVRRLEQSAETVADTVEPLQGAAQRVGRITGRARSRAS